MESVLREERSKTPFASVPRHGVSDFLAGREPDLFHLPGGEVEEDEGTRMGVFPPPVDELKLAIELQRLVVL